MLRRFFCKLLLVAVVIFGLLALTSSVMAQGRSEAFERVKEVQERHTLKLMAKKGVVGTAIGLNDKGKHDVIVLLEKGGVPGIPQELEGVPVRPIVSGKIYAFVDPTARFSRPVPIGVSTGHPDITAGTIACRVYDDENENGMRDVDEAVFALSNNHVYADENLAEIGDAVIQPGTYDWGSSPADDIGDLFEFEVIKFDGSPNIIDAAIASTTTVLVSNATPSDGYGTPKSTTVTPGILQSVQKYGRTTGLTSGMVFGANSAVNVQYTTGVAYFENQIMIYGNFSAGGDSGSLVVTDPGKEPVGLLFAGGGGLTFANPIGPVLSQFGVKIDSSEGPVDNPPVVEITNPADGAIVSGTIDVTADASDDDGVTQVEFFLDGLSIMVDTTAPYSTSWDSASVGDGFHEITAIATDTIGQDTSDTISVVVDNYNDPPTADFTYTTSNLTAYFTDTSTDSDGSVDFWNWDFGDESTSLDTSTQQNPDYTYPAAGTYTVTLTVIDDDGTTDSVSKNVTVSEAADMSVTITRHTVKTRWDKKNGVGKVEVQINFTVNSGSSNQIIIQEVDDEVGTEEVWELEKTQSEVKINGVRYKWDTIPFDFGDIFVAAIDFYGVTLEAGDDVQIKMKLLNNEKGSHTLRCFILDFLDILEEEPVSWSW